MKLNTPVTKPYLFTVAALLALPFALHAANENYQTRSQAPLATTEPMDTDNRHPVSRQMNQLDNRTDSRGYRTVYYYDRDNVVAPRLDRTSRTSNGVARGVAEARAADHDEAMNSMLITTDSNMDQRNDARSSYPLIPTAQTTAASNARPSTAVDLSRDDAIALRLNSEQTTDTIESTEFAGRERAIDLAETGLSDGQQIAAALRASSATVRADSRQDIDKEMREVEKARAKLAAAITSSRNATEARWDDVRDELSERYEDYADALENARETAVDEGVRFGS